VVAHCLFQKQGSAKQQGAAEFGLWALRPDWEQVGQAGQLGQVGHTDLNAFLDSISVEGSSSHSSSSSSSSSSSISGSSGVSGNSSSSSGVGLGERQGAGLRLRRLGTRDTGARSPPPAAARFEAAPPVEGTQHADSNGAATADFSGALFALQQESSTCGSGGGGSADEAGSGCCEYYQNRHLLQGNGSSATHRSSSSSSSSSSGCSSRGVGIDWVNLGVWEAHCWYVSPSAPDAAVREFEGLVKQLQKQLQMQMQMQMPSPASPPV
jgi:hypothetical protein